MRNALPLILSVASAALLLLGGCKKEDIASSTQTCPDEKVLEVYQSKEAKVIKTELDRYCLTVDAADVALPGGYGYQIQNVLVPAADLPATYRVEGLHVRLSGRKKSCFGLTSLPTTFGAFGYKLEVDAIQAAQ
jgi:hypothetical protein